MNILFAKILHTFAGQSTFARFPLIHSRSFTLLLQYMEIVAGRVRKNGFFRQSGFPAISAKIFGIRNKSFHRLIRSSLLLVFAAAAVCNAEETVRSGHNFQIGQPVKTDAKSWYSRQVASGADVYLSANYLFQVMKLESQVGLMNYETSALYPKLVSLMGDLKKSGLNGDALIFVEVSRMLLDPAAEIDTQSADSVKKIVDDFTKNPENQPRGHYTSSETLRRYFHGMQFLTKATFDVEINKKWFSYRKYMLFPFSAAEELRKTLSDPKNGNISARYNEVFGFYDKVVGSADLPTFHDLIARNIDMKKVAVSVYCAAQQIPKINKEMGIGIQFFGERFTAHQSVINSITEAVLAGDPTVDRAKAFQALRFKNVFFGLKDKAVSVPGLNSLEAKSGNDLSYYDACVAAINALPNATQEDYRLNAVASSVTALAEQTILVTKQTRLMPKSALMDGKKKVSNIYVQPEISEFLTKLENAHAIIAGYCDSGIDKDYYGILRAASQSGKPVKADSPEGVKLMNIAGTAALEPTVTADVFFYDSNRDKAFLQWSIGPFEVEYAVGGNKVKGMEMVFFEAWNDEIVKGTKDPVNNAEWQKAFSSGIFKTLGGIIQAK